MITLRYFSLPPDPASWGADVRAGHAKEDAILHNPDPRRDRAQGKTGNIFTGRGISNLGFLFSLLTVCRPLANTRQGSTVLVKCQVWPENGAWLISTRLRVHISIPTYVVLSSDRKISET
ncbi:hypothetical protein FIBSPDRAFT_104309 [Athelia psychrophila]|uniref:Uncharacterized protein n=1 Tax=Athelia psychrophila TaxID=1759441 RepID=A0A166DDK5_9AGAM|nr:hypothetical protein FIBSPDRAFT_104309 [Fibularhizoctonia sp. CBS 109695]